MPSSASPDSELAGLADAITQSIRCDDIQSPSSVPVARMAISAPAPDPFADRREAMRQEFFGKLFLLGGFLGGTDTYKRTMWAAVPDIAVARACYTLTMRKGLPEPGAGDQLIMAGHEAMLAQWFHRPLRRADVELARAWFSERAHTRAFPTE